MWGSRGELSKNAVFFSGNATTVKVRKCKSCCREILLSLRRPHPLWICLFSQRKRPDPQWIGGPGGVHKLVHGRFECRPLFFGMDGVGPLLLNVTLSIVWTLVVPNLLHGRVLSACHRS